MATRYADALTLDQLEIFTEVADAGSFTKAAKRLRRAQSAVSYGMGRLEALLGVKLLERSLTGARLTPQGHVLLAEARQALGRIDHLRAAGLAFSEDVEPEVSISVSPLYPVGAFGAIVREMRDRFPHTQLRVYDGTLGAAIQDVSTGRATLGLTAITELPANLVSVPCGLAVLTKVVGPDHALARHRARITDAELKKHLQLVGTDTTDRTKSLQVNVISPTTWRIADTMIRYQLALASVGWTHFPSGLVAADLATRRLIELRTEKNVPAPSRPLLAFYRIAAPPGPAGRWLLERLSNAPTNSAAASQRSRASAVSRGAGTRRRAEAARG